MIYLHFFFAACTAALVIWLLAKATMGKARLTAVSGVFPFLYNAEESGVDERRMSAQVHRAYGLLCKYGPWDQNRLWAALTNVRIWVQPVRVHCTAGVHDITVDPSLVDLCHELAHIAEAHLDGGAPDCSHQAWDHRGLNTATAIFIQEL